MKVDECTADVRTSEEGDTLPCVGLTSSALPEAQSSARAESSQTGVSTRNVPYENTSAQDNHKETKQWCVLRSTHGTEKIAYDYLCERGIKAYYPTVKVEKVKNGLKSHVEESRLPNIFFAYSTFDELKEYVYDNFHNQTKRLRFYYNQHHDGSKEPLIVPLSQMIMLMQICEKGGDQDILLEPRAVEQFIIGQKVRVKEGTFTGVEGIVKRYKGQQRVGIVVGGIFTVITAYISKDRLEPVD